MCSANEFDVSVTVARAAAAIQRNIFASQCVRIQSTRKRSKCWNQWSSQFALSQAQCNWNNRSRAFTWRAQQWIPLNCDARARYHLTVESSTRFSAASPQKRSNTRSNARQQKPNWYKKARNISTIWNSFFLASALCCSCSPLFYCCAIKFYCSKKTLKSKRKYAHFVRYGTIVCWCADAFGLGLNRIWMGEWRMEEKIRARTTIEEQNSNEKPKVNTAFDLNSDSRHADGLWWAVIFVCNRRTLLRFTQRTAEGDFYCLWRSPALISRAKQSTYFCCTFDTVIHRDFTNNVNACAVCRRGEAETKRNGRN